MLLIVVLVSASVVLVFALPVLASEPPTEYVAAGSNNQSEENAGIVIRKVNAETGQLIQSAEFDARSTWIIPQLFRTLNISVAVFFSGLGVLWLHAIVFTSAPSRLE